METIPEKSIALFGGSFDPVHNAHLEMARRALSQTVVDEIWFMPAASPPHKKQGLIASVEDRCEMLALAIKDTPEFVFLDLELRSGSSVFMVDSLQKLKTEFPLINFFMLIGEDSFVELNSWKSPAAIASLADFIVCPRPGSDGKALPVYENASVYWLEGPGLAVSSRKIRNAIPVNASRLDVPVAVEEYILERGLYLEEKRP